MSSAERSALVDGHGLVLGDDAARPSAAVSRSYSRYLASACQRFLTLDSVLPASLRPAHARIVELIGRALPGRRAALLGCFRSPAVSAPLQCAHLRDDLPGLRPRIDRALAACLPHLLLEMSLRGLVPEGATIDWEQPPLSLAANAIGGELIAPPGTTALRFSARELVATAGGSVLARLSLRDELSAALASTSGFRFARRFRRVGNVCSFTTLDPNPIAQFELHPEKSGNAVDLGGRPEEEWGSALDSAFALIERFLPGELAEMRLVLQLVVPVGYDGVRHLSASYREAVGVVYLTLHPNLMTMTEALIHEFQHNKLNAASYAADFLLNPFHPLYKSPVRPDPRPLWGILLAVHAFLPVAELYRRMRDGGHPLAAHHEFERRTADIDLKNHEGMEMLRAHAELTPAGRALLDELETLERRHLAEHRARGTEIAPTASHPG